MTESRDFAAKRSPLQQFKAVMSVGAEIEVTNHYITREDHPCYGTTHRTVTNTNTSSWSYYEPAHSSDHANKWPKASNVKANDDGTFAIFGHPKADDLFLTIKAAQ